MILRLASGSDQSVLWDGAAIASFVTLWNSAKSNGWTLSPSIFPTMNIAAMAAAAPGKYYAPWHSADPLGL